LSRDLSRGAERIGDKPCDVSAARSCVTTLASAA